MSKLIQSESTHANGLLLFTCSSWTRLKSNTKEHSKKAPPSYSGSTDEIKTGKISAKLQLGKESTRVVCPYCHAKVKTETERTAGVIAYISGCTLALLGLVCGCCLIPCCIDDFQDVMHVCSNCKAYLGYNSMLGSG